MSPSNQIESVVSGAELVVVSDLHLIGLEDKKALTFQALLDLASHGRVRHLVMLGDVFEFILGSSPYFQKKYSGLGKALQELVANGVQVYFLEGNHEYALRRLDWAGVQLVDDLEFTVCLEDGRKVLFTHGDQIYAPKAYLRFRKIVKAPWFLKCARWVPGYIMDRLTLWAARASRAQDSYRSLDEGAVVAAMAKWLGDRGDYGVFGHFHIPVCASTSDGRGLLAGPDWSRPSALLYSGGGWKRFWMEGENFESWRIDTLMDKS